MADMKITEYNSHNAPATGDQFFMIGASEEYRIDYDTLASAILDKLTSKTYSDINNNVISAIAALNSRVNAKALKSGDDLNTFSDANSVGKYYAASGAIASTLSNCPTTNNFVMEVVLKGMYVTQMITDTTSIYVRTLTSSGFSKWYKYLGTEVS